MSLQHYTDSCLMDSMSVIEKIEALRLERGISQDDLAEAVGIRQATISEWKKPESKGPRVAVAFRIARVLGVSLDYLADDEQEEPPASLITPAEQALIEALRKAEISPADLLAWLMKPSGLGSVRNESQSEARGRPVQTKRDQKRAESKKSPGGIT